MKYKKVFTLLAMLLGLFMPLASAHALTGTGLPSGCHGGESFINYGAPDSYEWVWDSSGPHLAVYYEFPYTSYGSYDLCWAAFHGRMNTDAYSGGSDNWDAELSGGELMILVPKSLWLYYYSRGYSTSSFVSMFYPGIFLLRFVFPTIQSLFIIFLVTVLASTLVWSLLVYCMANFMRSRKNNKPSVNNA